MEDTTIRKYVSHFLYSDVHAYEVVKIVSPITVKVRRLKATIQNPTDLQFQVGGFVAHCANQHAQRYTYESDESYGLETLRLSKRGWGKGRWQMRDEPYEFYDYNF